MSTIKLNKFLKSYFKPKYIALIFSFLSALALLFSSFLSYRSLQKNLETNLNLQALSIQIILQSLLKNFDLSFLQYKREFFSDLLLNEKWDGVAFIAFYDKNLKILLHSNPELIGQKIDYSPILNKNKHSDYYTLKTGEKVFLYEDLVSLKDWEGVLRIALHVKPVEDTLFYAKKHLYVEIGIAILFLIAGLFAYVLFHKMEREREKVEELERWQFISRLLLHEIKNPLASIKGFTQFLSKKSKEEVFNQALEIILRETLRIENLLKRLYEYSYTSEIELKSFDLIKLLEEIIASMKFIYPDANIKLQTQNQTPVLHSDPEKLKSILINLLDNALYASFAKGSKEVFIDLKEMKEHYILKIRDEGEGMDEKELSQIFKPFYTTKAKGTGLGLTIVKKLCEELKIEIKFESLKGQGTTVWLKIPLFLL